MGEVIERFVEVPGGHLYSRTAGAGRDVLLLHAGAADQRMWDSTVAWLSAVARVTTFDFRDMGLSCRAGTRYSELDDIAAVLDAAGVDRALLIGCSDGARRALAFAHRHPERVERVVAVGAAFGDFPDPSAEESAARAAMHEHYGRLMRMRTDAAGSEGRGLPEYAEADIAAWGPALGTDARRKMVGLQLANAYWIELEESLGAELDPPVQARFAELAVPVTVVVGDRDFAATRLWARRIAGHAPGATLTELPAADHFPMLSAPDAFERLIRTIL